MTRPIVALLPALMLALVPFAADAGSLQGTNAVKRWKLADDCARQAQLAFPDYTAESNAKRDARLKECLESRNLPSRE